MQEVVSNQIAIYPSNPTEGKVELTRILQGKVFGGRIHELQLNCSGLNLISEDLVQLVDSAFGSKILPEDIRIQSKTFGENEEFFAEKFGFKFFPEYAYFSARRNLIQQNLIEIASWVGPVLLRKNHPIAAIKNQGAVLLSVYSKSAPKEFQKMSYIYLIGFGDKTPTIYMHLSVLDKPSVLGQISRIFGDNNINIHGVEQPLTTNTNTKTEMAFILDSCPSIRFQDAKEKIADLSVCERINAVLPILG